MAGESWQMPWGGAQSGVGGLLEQGQDFNQVTSLWGVDAYINNSIYIRDFFTSAECYSGAVYATATSAVGSSGLEIDAPAAGDSASVYRRMVYAITANTWAKSRKFKTIVYNFGTQYKYGFIGTGYGPIGASWSTPGVARHFGFWIDGTSLYGSVSNGTSNTLLDLSVTLSTAALTPTLEAVFTSGIGVEFIVGGVSKGTITTNLPSGTNSSDFIFFMAVYAKVSAYHEALGIQEFAFFQE